MITLVKENRDEEYDIISLGTNILQNISLLLIREPETEQKLYNSINSMKFLQIERHNSYGGSSKCLNFDEFWKFDSSFSNRYYP